MYLNKQYK